MPNLDFQELIVRSLEIRQRYHELERQHHGSEWSVEEDALAFVTDAALVGRHTMSQQGRWPHAQTDEDLEHKLGECLWWLTILASRLDMDIGEATEKFLTKTEKALKA